MATTTIVSRLRQKFETVDECIADMLEMNVTELAYMKYEYGLQYLDIRFEKNEGFIRIMETSAIFWGWFKNWWNIHDEEFLRHQDLREHRLPVRQDLYRMLHCPKTLTEDTPMPMQLITKILESHE